VCLLSALTICFSKFVSITGCPPELVASIVQIWANKLGIDPEYRDAIPYPLYISLGVNIGI